MIDVNLDGNVGLKLAAHQAALATQSNLFISTSRFATQFFFFVQRGLQSGDCLQHLAGISVPLRSINSILFHGAKVCACGRVVQDPAQAQKGCPIWVQRVL